MSTQVRFEHFWDRIRYTQIRLSSYAQNRRKRNNTLEPGDIGCCESSIERIFYTALEDNGIKLKYWEQGNTDMAQPKRYCIINRHIENTIYEVFVLTTFGGVKSFQRLGELGRYFGIPMGHTQWISTTPGLMTIPHIWFGRTFPSFAFSIPCITNVEPTMLKYYTRLAPGELERLQRYAEDKRKAMLRDEQFLRKSTKTSHLFLYRKEWPVTYDDHDQFRPLSTEEDDLLPEEELEHLFFPEPYHSKLTRSVMKRQFLGVPRRKSDISWVARHSSKDILNGTAYIPPGVRFRTGPLPKPYYAACLRVSLKQITRVLR